MKRRISIILMICIIAVVGLVAGCQTKLDATAYYDLASFKDVTPDTEYKILVKCGEDLLFKNVNGEIEAVEIEGVKFENLIGTEQGTGLTYESSYFSEENLDKDTETLTANIADGKAFLGIDDVTKGSISIKTSGGEFVKSTIEYTVTKKIKEYTVYIEVVAK